MTLRKFGELSAITVSVNRFKFERTWPHNASLKISEPDGWKCANYDEMEVHCTIPCVTEPHNISLGGHQLCLNHGRKALTQVKNSWSEPITKISNSLRLRLNLLHILRPFIYNCFCLRRSASSWLFAIVNLPRNGECIERNFLSSYHFTFNSSEDS